MELLGLNHCRKVILQEEVLDAGGTTRFCSCFWWCKLMVHVTESWNGFGYGQKLCRLRNCVQEVLLGGGSQGSSNVLNIGFGGDPDVVSTEEWTVPSTVGQIQQ